ncbi:MAG: hypothetical protein Q4B40_07465, partial [Clostridia bacterium]|nr:hypothetical protein [Clostridia bacterium]
MRKRHDFTINEMFANSIENYDAQENVDEKNDGYKRRAKEIDLTLPQIMSIYAYSKREQAEKHMLEGGFIFNANETVKGENGFEYTKNQAEPFRPSPESIVDIINTLTDEQKAYVDKMQNYLSDVMGAKGNEVSRTLFDIDLFKEKFYFPLKSSNEYLKIKNTPVTASSLINSGMTKEIIPGAKNPIILSSFDDVWADHVNKMSTYHALAVPLENFRKVFEYSINSDGSNAKSVRLAIQAVYGEAAKDYVQKFMDDLNGGIAVNREKGLFEKGFTKMKKTAVAVSLSVAIQQPTAIIRAMADIAPKYFFGLKVDKGSYSQKWAELKKYAPIAVLKEIGGWDAGGSRGVIDYLDKGSRLSKGKKVLRTIDEKSMWLAEQGDVIGWCTIWEAVKRETKAKYSDIDTKSDEFLTICGERFNDVVTQTQVYDSTFSRSGFMRSDNAFDRMATSFMGEPTTSVNMLYNAALQLKRGNINKRTAARTFGAVIAASIAAEALKGFIVALGDDDEDESYIEKYLQATLENPLKSMALYIPEMLPYMRDLISIFEGYGVERSDMQIYQDIVDAYKALDSQSKSGYRKAEDFIGAIGNVFGIPVKNAMKTGRQIYNIVRNIADDNYLSFDKWGNAAKDAMFGETTAADVNKALDKGKTEKAQEYIEHLLEDCDTDEEIKKKKSSIKRSVTTYWKPLYIEAYMQKDNTETLRIRRALYATGLYDDVGKTVQTWIKNSRDTDDDENFWGDW